MTEPERLGNIIMCSLQKSKLLIPGVPEWSVWPSKFTCSTYEQCKSKKMSVSPRLTRNSAQMIAIFITPNTLSTPSFWGHCQTVLIFRQIDFCTQNVVSTVKDVVMEVTLKQLIHYSKRFSYWQSLWFQQHGKVNLSELHPRILK